MRNDNLKKIQFPEQPPTQQAGYSLPTDFVKLPSKGKFYPEEHPLHNQEDVEISFMTTKEEDILTSPAYNKKGIVFDKLIDSLLVDKRIKASKMLLGDKNAIIINARMNAYENVSSVTQNSFCIDCISRVLFLEDEFDNELSEILEVSSSEFRKTLPESLDNMKIEPDVKLLVWSTVLVLTWLKINLSR